MPSLCRRAAVDEHSLAPPFLSQVIDGLPARPLTGPPQYADTAGHDPMLADPADNGGPTFTMLPNVGSPVLAAGANCETSDQRGHPRNTAACDLGAVEMPR